MVRLVLPVLACLASPALADELYFFHSPSGNIHCMIATGEWSEARCDMMELTQTFTTPPAGCDLDWGNVFTVEPRSGRGELGCVGDTVVSPGSDVLDYGQSVSLGGLTCSSAESGMTCTNAAGHGFTIRKARQDLF